MTKNMRRINLFCNNKNFTLIFVLNYVCKKLIDKADLIYFAKNRNNNIIDSYYNQIEKYYKNKTEFTNKIKKISDYGFICLDKDNKYKKEEEFIILSFNP